jgi:hypothetical protein
LVPFNNTAKPILAAAQLPRQPASARTNRNMNTVACYGLLQLIRWSLPSAVPKFTRLMDSLKLDPDATTGMAGIGNTVADAWRQHVLKVCTQLLQCLTRMQPAEVACNWVLDGLCLAGKLSIHHHLLTRLSLSCDRAGHESLMSHAFVSALPCSTG